KSVAVASRDDSARRSCSAGEAASSSSARRIADGFGSVTHNARFLLRAHFTAEQYSGPQMTTGRLSCIASIILEGKLVVIRRRCDGAKLMTTNAAWNFCSDSANSFGAMNPR